MQDDADFDPFAPGAADLPIGEPVELRPAPPIPADADLRGFNKMPVNIVALNGSVLWSSSTGDEFKAAFALWSTAWHQVPAGSLPNHPRALVKFAGYDKAPHAWRKVRDMAMRGWSEHSDGRLYHGVLAGLVLEALRSQWSKKAGGKATQALKKTGNRSSTSTSTSRTAAPAAGEQGKGIEEKRVDNPPTPLGKNPYLVDLDPAQVKTTPMPLPDFAELIVRRLNADPRTCPIPPVQAVLGILAELRANGSKLPAQDLLNHAERVGERYGKDGGSAHNPLAVLRKVVVPEALAFLAQRRPSDESPLDRDAQELQTKILVALTSFGQSGPVRPRQAPGPLWEIIAGRYLPDQRGCRIPLATTQAALRTVGMEWRDGAAREREK